MLMILGMWHQIPNIFLTDNITVLWGIDDEKS